MNPSKVTNVVSKEEERVIQKAKVTLGGPSTGPGSHKPPKKPEGSVTFRGTKEAKVEVVSSQHIETKDENVSGRYGG